MRRARRSATKPGASVLAGTAKALAAATVATALLGSCTSRAVPGSSSVSRVITLNRITTLKARFNHAYGRTRLVLIFSPT